MLMLTISERFTAVIRVEKGGPFFALTITPAVLSLKNSPVICSSPESTENAWCDAPFAKKFADCILYSTRKQSANESGAGFFPADLTPLLKTNRVHGEPLHRVTQRTGTPDWKHVSCSRRS
jgi:hypothetical protein